MAEEKPDDLARSLAEQRFARLYHRHNADVLAYALRRAPTPEDAADVVAETFLVAWRRLADVPDEVRALLWLYGVARRTLANQRRGELRRGHLAKRMRHELVAKAQTQPTPGGFDAVALGGLARLDEEDREILLLVGWEELKPGEVARLLDISSVAARSRLHRARRRLRAVLEDSQLPKAHEPNAELEREEAQ